MSKPSANERAKFAAERIADAEHAAVHGGGWKALAQKWGVTNACALQWCRDNLHPRTCKIIGENGRRAREPFVGHKGDYAGKPKLIDARMLQPVKPNEACRKVSYRDGDAYECGLPTNGKTYCAGCAQKLLTLTDRAALPDQPAPKPFHWASEQILPRKRA